MKIWFNSNNSKVHNLEIFKAFKERILHMNFLSHITSHINHYKILEWKSILISMFYDVPIKQPFHIFGLQKFITISE
jgi:hypothetical protein